VTCPTSTLLTGSAKSVVDLSMAMDTTVPGGRVVITITGPSNVWFGVGFNAKQMVDRPYTVVIDGNGLVTERRIDDHAPGTLLTPTQVRVLSNNVENGFRTVVLSREFKGVTSNHYTFDPKKLVLPFINAVGRTINFSHHQFKGSTTMVFHASVGPTCVCDSGITGSLNGILFHNDRCAPYPISELLDQKNPTCSIQNYIGGTSCCLHEYILLDADQPVDPRIDEIRLKYRIWYQEYQPSQLPMTSSKDQERAPTKASHMNLFGGFAMTENYAGEYDVPQCPAGTPPEDCVHQITSRVDFKNIRLDCAGIPNCKQNKKGMRLVSAVGHCHAPSCISLELFNADTGSLICRQLPRMGQGKGQFDEPGYISSMPPCLWGTEEEGLNPPPEILFDTKLLSIKRNNNTYHHYGEMAMWFFTGTYF